MSQLYERFTSGRPTPDEVALEPVPVNGSGTATVLRLVGAAAVVVVGVVHLEQYVGAHFDGVHVIGPLFLLNFISATLIGVGLLLPGSRVRALRALLALGGIGLAATSFVFLFISEHQPLFGFQEHGYRAAIIVTLVAEVVAVLALAGYLLTSRRT